MEPDYNRAAGTIRTGRFSCFVFRSGTFYETKAKINSNSKENNNSNPPPPRPLQKTKMKTAKKTTTATPRPLQKTKTKTTTTAQQQQKAVPRRYYCLQKRVWEEGWSLIRVIDMETRRLKTTTTGLAREMVRSSGWSSSGGSTVLKLRRITDDAVEVLFLYIYIYFFKSSGGVWQRGGPGLSLIPHPTLPPSPISCTVYVDIKHHERRKKVQFGWGLPERFADPK